MKITIILILITLLLGCTTLVDNNVIFLPTLPEATQSGANTFGCFIDGKLLTPRADIENKYSVDYSQTDTYLELFDEFIACDFVDEELPTLIVHLDKLKTIGQGNFAIERSNCRYASNAIPTINLLYTFKDKETNRQKYYCSQDTNGLMTITKYDTIQQIVSGAFNCIVANRDDATDIIEITDGRFDFKWNEINEIIFP